MKTLTVLVLTILFAEICADTGLLDKITSGFKLAGKILGLDHVAEISQLISNAFSSNRHQEDKAENENIFSGFLRIFGFDSKKIAAIGVNGIIFMAQLISSSLTKTTPKDVERNTNNEEDPLEWISSISGLQTVLEYSKHSNLPQTLIEYIQEHSLDEDTGCIQLLICKLSPFVKKMQTFLKNPTKDVGKSALFKYLPSIDEMEDMGDICEEKHPYCRVIY